MEIYNIATILRLQSRMKDGFNKSSNGNDFKQTLPRKRNTYSFNKTVTDNLTSRKEDLLNAKTNSFTKVKEVLRSSRKHLYTSRSTARKSGVTQKSEKSINVHQYLITRTLPNYCQISHNKKSKICLRLKRRPLNKTPFHIENNDIQYDNDAMIPIENLSSTIVPLQNINQVKVKPRQMWHCDTLQELRPTLKLLLLSRLKEAKRDSLLSHSSSEFQAKHVPLAISAQVAHIYNRSDINKQKISSKSINRPKSTGILQKRNDIMSYRTANRRSQYNKELSENNEYKKTAIHFRVPSPFLPSNQDWQTGNFINDGDFGFFARNQKYNQ